MPNINIELSEAQHRVASTLKSIAGMDWKELFLDLVNKEIERRGLNEGPAFKSKESK